MIFTTMLSRDGFGLKISFALKVGNFSNDSTFVYDEQFDAVEHF